VGVIGDSTLKNDWPATGDDSLWGEGPVLPIPSIMGLSMLAALLFRWPNLV